jgi:hypothetical protein
VRPAARHGQHRPPSPDPEIAEGQGAIPDPHDLPPQEHATFSERELLRAYHTWDALRGDDDIRAFIDRVA